MRIKISRIIDENGDVWSPDGEKTDGFLVNGKIVPLNPHLKQPDFDEHSNFESYAAAYGEWRLATGRYPQIPDVRRNKNGISRG